MLRALSNIYGYLVSRRNKQFDSGRLEIIKMNSPVISVGNISTGGTGKTPFAIMLANKLIEMGYQPSVAGRGYARKKKDISIISDGNEIFGSVADAGDEMFMLAQKLHIPVVVNDSKVKAAKILDDTFNPDLIIIDDGFQHRWLNRDLDIVLIDERTLANPELMPRGRLREPLTSLSRADIIVIIGDVEDIRAIEDYSKNSLIIRANTITDKEYNLFSDYPIDDEERSKAKEKAIAFSGIANPKKFHTSLIENAWNIADSISFPDHYRYSKSDLLKIEKRCRKYNTNNIITTEKDAVKLIEFREFFIENKLNCYVFSIEMIIIEKEEEFFQKIVSIIKSK